MLRSKDGKRREVAVSQPTNFAKMSHVNHDFKWTDFKEEDFESTLIGVGTYGKVFKSVHTSGFVIAIKNIPRSSDQSAWQEVEREINILSTCRHYAVVPYYGCALFSDRILIFLAYCENGSLHSLLRKVPQRKLAIDHIRAICLPLLQGLEYLHARNIIHRDLKADNILLNEFAVPMIADFGVSSLVQGTLKRQHTIVGTPLFMAPEVIDGDEYDTSADIWSFGIMVIQLATGYPPNADLHFMQALRKITSEPPPSLDPNDHPDDLVSFVASCLQKCAGDRPSATELLASPFISLYEEDVYKKIRLELLHFSDAEEVDSDSSPSDTPAQGTCGSAIQGLKEVEEMIQVDHLPPRTVEEPTIQPADPIDKAHKSKKKKKKKKRKGSAAPDAPDSHNPFAGDTLPPGVLSQIKGPIQEDDFIRLLLRVHKLEEEVAALRSLLPKK